MRMTEAAMGSRNYNMGMSKAPTRGKVNPSGYIKRELRNRNKAAGRGNDGNSDRRSGIAKAALKNVNKYAWNGPGKLQNPTMSTRPKPNLPNISIPKGEGFGSSVPKVGIPGGEGFGGPSQRPIPNISINKNGQLDLPFDEAFGLDLVDQQQGMNSELMDLQQQQQMQALQHANSKRDLGLQFEGVQRDTLNSNAGRGTAFSSQYAVGASDNARNYNNVLNDLDSANTLANSGFANQRMGIQNAFNDYVRQAVLRRTMDMAPGAGDLGYGIDAPNADWVDPKSPKKYPGKAQHNKATLKKAAKKSIAKKSDNKNKRHNNKKSSPIKRLKKR